jgi:CheY-like chemotaxis protein
LLIEDEVEVGDCAQELLELLECKVTRAENGKSAIESIKTMAFDIILVDLKMPVLNGWDFLEKLSELELATDARKYVLTGEIISQTDPQFKRLYKLADGVIQKPIRKIDLAKVLQLDEQDWIKG